MIRPPAVAGRFYSADPKQLAADVDQFVDNTAEKIRALGCVVPHAGYIYSGHVAGAVYSALQIPARCILIGPRHYPRGESMAILTEGSWQTPFGEAQIESALAAELAYACPRLRADAVAHQAEHSLEVQLPFLQRLVPGFRFVPVVLGTDRYPPLEELGHAMAEVIQAQKEPVLIIASSDMNHYEKDSITRVKDHRAIIQIVEMNPRGLYDTVRWEGITMCGYAAAVAMLVAVIDLGAKKARLIRYATSGDISGDREQVVGYAGIVVT
ncbi:MAG: AmmeMemoRadiSam system protein B [Candidatus Acidiferrales bacterium]